MEDKNLVKQKCKEIFPVAEKLKNGLKERYEKEYDIYLKQEVNHNF